MLNVFTHAKPPESMSSCFAEVDLIGTDSQYSSRSLVSGIADNTADIDPYIAISHRRLHALRRLLANDFAAEGDGESLVDLIQDTFDAYSAQKFVGAHSDDVDVDALCAAPLPHLWRSRVPLSGPIGLLLQNVHMMGATLTCTPSRFGHLMILTSTYVICPFRPSSLRYLTSR